MVWPDPVFPALKKASARISSAGRVHHDGLANGQPGFQTPEEIFVPGQFGLELSGEEMICSYPERDRTWSEVQIWSKYPHGNVARPAKTLG